MHVERRNDRPEDAVPFKWTSRVRSEDKNLTITATSERLPCRLYAMLRGLFKQVAHFTMPRLQTLILIALSIPNSS
jgi:hypothetical protein